MAAITACTLPLLLATAATLLTHDAFVRMNRRAIAMMFVRPSVCLTGTGVHCVRTVQFSADLSSWLGSPMFWALTPSMPTYSQPSFSSSTRKRGWVWTMDVQTMRDISRTVEDRG